MAFDTEVLTSKCSYNRWVGAQKLFLNMSSSSLSFRYWFLMILLDAFPKEKGSLLRKLGVRSKGESSLSPILFELWSVFSPSFDSETTDIYFSDGSANTMKLLDRGNSSGLCSSHAAVQNATTDGRARGFTETTRVKSIQAFSASFSHPCLYQRWCQRINHLNDRWKLLAGGVVFLGCIKHLETLELQSQK